MVARPVNWRPAFGATTLCAVAIPIATSPTGSLLACLKGTDPAADGVGYWSVVVAVDVASVEEEAVVAVIAAVVTVVVAVGTNAFPTARRLRFLHYRLPRIVAFGLMAVSVAFAAGALAWLYVAASQ